MEPQDDSAFMTSAEIMAAAKAKTDTGESGGSNPAYANSAPLRVKKKKSSEADYLQPASNVNVVNDGNE